MAKIPKIKEVEKASKTAIEKIELKKLSKKRLSIGDRIKNLKSTETVSDIEPTENIASSQNLPSTPNTEAGLAESLKTRVKARISEKILRESRKIPDSKKVRPIIQVKNLIKKFGSFTAVDNISFEVKKGEIFGILGPNGAGKTTTLEIIETLLPKTSGQIFIDGLNIDTYPEHVKRIVGIQLQSSGFYPKINLVETLEMYADIYNVRINAMQMLENVSLVDKAKCTPEQLSGGQRQRFSIATTLVADPLIIFLDEPTTGLDPQARRNLWDMVLSLKNKGKTIVLTTHYMDEAEVLCDRIAIMDGGKILEINTAQNYIENLLAKGFVRPQPKLGATLEDVFLDITGKQLRE